MLETMPPQYQDDFYLHPIYPVFEQWREIGGAFTGKGVESSNRHFSFHRPAASDPTYTSKFFRANLQELAHNVGFEPGNVLLPNGAWPHTGEAIKQDVFQWVTDPASRTLVPVTKNQQPVTYDAIATRSSSRVLAVQGADCPAIFLYDPCARVIGLAHAGWKPLVRNVVGNLLGTMEGLGARRQNILAHISPGAGDRYNAFKWDDDMEESVKDVFIRAGRQDLLDDPRIRHTMSADEYKSLRNAGDRGTNVVATLKLSYLATAELIRCGIDEVKKIKTRTWRTNITRTDARDPTMGLA